LARVALAPYQPYLPVAARLEGRADADVTVRGGLASPPGVAVRGTAALGDLAIRDGDRRVLAADRVETTGLDYAWPARLVVDRVRIQKPRARIERKADGSFPLAALLSPQSPASRETTEEAPGGASPSPGASPQSAGAGATAPFLTPTSPPSGAG